MLPGDVYKRQVPRNYFPAVEKGLQECVLKGPVAGYPVVGLKATLLDGSYHPVDTDVYKRQLTPVAWLGSTMMGRWLFWRMTGTALISRVFLVEVSYVRMPRSHSTILGLSLIHI